MKNSGIYCVENLKNGKKYIGQSYDLEGRKTDHFRRLSFNSHHNAHLQNSYLKYGKENFKFKVLLYCESFELTRYEQFFVGLYDPKTLYNIRTKCVDSNIGINLSKESRAKISKNHADVSGKNNPFYGKTHSNEAKKKMSVVHSGKTISEEQKAKLSRHFSGKNNPMYGVRLFGEKNGFYGKKHSEETLRKISGEKGSNAKLKEKDVFKILDLYYNQKYTQVQISKLFSVAATTIHLIVRGKNWKQCYQIFMKNNGKL